MIKPIRLAHMHSQKHHINWPSKNFPLQLRMQYQCHTLRYTYNNCNLEIHKKDIPGKIIKVEGAYQC